MMISLFMKARQIIDSRLSGFDAWELGRYDRRNVLVSSCRFRRSQGARRPRLRIFLDEIGGPLTDHHTGEIGIGVGDRRHDRGITDPEIFHAVDAQLLIDDRHGIGFGAHFASANAVKIAGVSGSGRTSPNLRRGSAKTVHHSTDSSVRWQPAAVRTSWLKPSLEYLSDAPTCADRSSASPRGQTFARSIGRDWFAPANDT